MHAQTSDSSASPKRALLVGAYERDNFGDELFLLITEHYLTHHGYEVIAAAPLAADMTPLLDRKIDRFVDRLTSETFDLVWTVGGEAGGIGVNDAIRLSTTPERYSQYLDSDAAGRSRIRRELMGAASVNTPYMPRLSAFPRNVLTPTVINSLGIGSISKASTDRRAQILRVVREATVVSVRDPRGSRALAAAGIEHTLAPDLVHTIRHVHPRPVGESGSGHVLIQINQAQTRSIGLTRFADALASSDALRPYPLRLFFAGLASGHDSPAEYRRIRERILHKRPGRDVEILDGSRRPWDLVDEIRRSALWLGASLHGRIVASAYDVPRVSLARRKVDVYARKWDDAMPLEVTIDRLDSAVRSALSPATRAEAAGVGERLAALAEANMLRSITLAGYTTPEETAVRRASAQEAEVAILRRERDAALKHRSEERVVRSTKRGLGAIAEAARSPRWRALTAAVEPTWVGRRIRALVDNR